MLFRSNAGDALLGFGEATGDDRATIATNMAITSPLLEDISIDGAKGVLLNITGNKKDLKMSEVGIAASIIHNAIHSEAQFIYGQAFDDDLKDTIRITVIATGFLGDKKASRQKKAIFKEENRRIDDLTEKYYDIPAYKRIKAKKLK